MAKDSRTPLSKSARASLGDLGRGGPKGFCCGSAVLLRDGGGDGGFGGRAKEVGEGVVALGGR